MGRAVAHTGHRVPPDWTARGDVCAGRLVPGAGVATLEELVHTTLGRLRADGGPWPLDTVSGPRVFTVGGINYLAARITVRVPITGG